MLEKAQDQRGELTCCWEPKGSYFKFYYNFRKFSWDSSAFWFWVQTNRLKRSSQTQLQYAMRNMHSHYEDCSFFLRKRRSAVADLSIGMKWMFEQHLDIQSAERKLTVLLQPMSGDHWERSCKGVRRDLNSVRCTRMWLAIGISIRWDLGTTFLIVQKVNS